MDGIIRAFSVGDHGDAGSLHIRGGLVNGNRNPVHGKNRPFHMNKAFFPIGSRTLFCQPAVGAVGGATLGIMDQEIYATVHGPAIHPPSREPQGYSRGMAHFRVIGTLLFCHG